MAKKLKPSLHAKYKEISVHITKYNNVELEKLGVEMYLPTLKAAFIKCFEFNFYITKIRNEENSFYYLSFLRGMCEDLISLKFLLNFKLEERDKFLYNYSQYLLFTSMQSQTNFFEAEKLIQPLVNPKNLKDLIETSEQNVKSFWASHGHNKDKIFPGVEHMAIDSKLKVLYDFLYHATSRTVHFSPNVLLRTGWYDKKGGPVIFSIKNFSHYYYYFNIYFGTYLFILYAKSFRKELKLDKNFFGLIKDLDTLLKNNYEAPEIVTFEEMNLQRPDPGIFRVFTLISKMKADERKELLKNLPEIIDGLKKKGRKANKLVEVLTIINEEQEKK
jgi:hypothetical protein